MPHPSSRAFHYDLFRNCITCCKAFVKDRCSPNGQLLTWPDTGTPKPTRWEFVLAHIGVTDSFTGATLDKKCAPGWAGFRPEHTRAIARPGSGPADHAGALDFSRIAALFKLLLCPNFTLAQRSSEENKAAIRDTKQMVGNRCSFLRHQYGT